MNIDHTILTSSLLPARGRGPAGLAARRGQADAVGRARRHPRHLCSHAASSHPLRLRRRRRHLPVRQNLSWISSPAIRYHLGVDGLSMWLVVLTGFLAPLGVLISWNTIGDAQEALLHPLPAPAGRDARHLRLARPLPLLRFLGAVPRPHGASDRHLRPHRQPPPRRDQVLPLHLHPLSDSAGRHALALRPHRHVPAS